MKRLRQSNFALATAKLAGGTGAAQIITIAALPVLTRVYSPQDFELLAVYLSILGIVSVITCLRLEIAIPIPESDIDGAELAVLAFLSNLLFSAILALGVLNFSEQLALALGAPSFSAYLWLLPAGTLMAGSYNSLQYWATRKKHFGLVARTRLVQAVSGVGVQIGAGFAGITPLGLLLGHMLYGGAGALELARCTWREDRAIFAQVTLHGMRKRLHEYRRYPQFSTFEALANSAAFQIPVILIAALTIGAEAGFVLLASRVMGTPMQLVGRAVGQVYLSRAPEEMRAGRLRAFTLNIVAQMAKIIIPVLLIVAMIAQPLFGLVFGDDWRRAGELVQWMTPWFILQFISSPVSALLHVTDRLGTMLVLQIFGLILRVGAVVGASMVMGAYLTEAYAISGAVFYGVFLIVVIKTAND